MEKYIIILSLFLTSCSPGSKPYKVRVIENNIIYVILMKDGYDVGDTIMRDFKYSNNNGQGINWIQQKAVITKKIEK